MNESNQKSTEKIKNDIIIPQNFFEIPKEIVLIDISFIVLTMKNFLNALTETYVDVRQTF